MTPMTTDDRALIEQAIGDGHPAAPELVYATAQRLGYTGSIANALGPGMRHEIAAVIRRLLNAEQQLTTLRRIIATAITVADDNPDYGLTAGELLHLLTGSGLDLTQDIADAEQLRNAEQLAGAR